MHIGIDVDGVLRELLVGIRNQYARKYPSREKYLVEPEEVDEWGIRKMATREDIGLHMEEISLHDPKFSFRCFFRCPAIAGQIEQVKRLYRDLSDEHVVSICTSQDEHPRRVATSMWLMDHGVRSDNVIMSGSSKGDFDIDVLFDDRVKNCVAVEQNGGVGVLKKQKYNEGSRKSVGYSADSISEFHSIVKTL